MQFLRPGVAVLVSAVLLLTPLVVSPAAAAVAVPHLRVMPLGDSITAGVGSSNGAGYRLPLWREMRRQTSFTMDFVGSQHNGTAPDPDHEGHSGWMIEQIRAGVDAWLAQFTPDVVLLHIGINDLDRGTDKDHAVDRLAVLVDQIFADRPDVTIVLSGLLQNDPGLTQAVARYNTGVRQIVAAHAEKGDRIRYVNMPLTAEQMADRLHPADAGYAVMAESFGAGLEQAVAEGRVTTSPAPHGSAPETSSKVRWADFDGDGRDDYLLLTENNALLVWLNRVGDIDGDWSYLGQVAKGVAADRRRVRLADFDGDKKADYLVITPAGAVTVYLNRGGDGYGGWSNMKQIAAGLTSDANRVRFADFDGDRKADYVLFAATGAVTVYLNRGGDLGGGWSNIGQIATGLTSEANRVRLADLDGDAKADYLVIAGGGAVSAFLNRGGDGYGGWKVLGQVTGGATADADQVRFARLNADARADYLRVNATGTVDASINKGGYGDSGWGSVEQVFEGAVIE